MDRPFPPWLAAVAETLREGDDPIPDSAVACAVGMEIFEMLAGSERPVVEPKLLTPGSVKVLLIGWLICQPPDQRPILWVFTILPPMFIIFEQSLKNRRRGSSPSDGGFSMLDRRREGVKPLERCCFPQS